MGFIFTRRHRSKKRLQRTCTGSSWPKKQNDENLNSRVVPERIKLQANSSYGFQKKKCSQHNVTKCLRDEMTHAAIVKKVFKKLGYVNFSFYRVQLAKLKIEHTSHSFSGSFFFNMQNFQCWNSTTSFPPTSVRETNSSSWKWIGNSLFDRHQTFPVTKFWKLFLPGVALKAVRNIWSFRFSAMVLFFAPTNQVYVCVFG